MTVWLQLFLMLLTGAALAAPDPAAVEPNVFRIITPDRDGTGFWIADANVLLTTWHLVESADSIAVAVPRASKVELLPARVVKSSVAYDVALLAVEGLTRPGLVLAHSDGMAKGQAVWAVGFPPQAGASDAAQPSLTGGSLEHLVQRTVQDDGPPLTLLQHATDIGPDNSGSPLLDACGQVIGVNTHAQPGVLALRSYQYALSVAEIRTLLGRWAIPYRSAEAPCLGPLQAARSAGWLIALLIGLIAVVLAWVGRRYWRRILHQQAGSQRYSLDALNGALKTGPIDGGEPLEAAPVGRMAILKLMRGNNALCLIQCPIDRPCERVIGRSAPLCDLILDDDTISRRHVRLFWQPQPGEWYIEDLNSSNGTRLNDRVLQAYIPALLRHAFRLRLGELELTVAIQT